MLLFLLGTFFFPCLYLFLIYVVKDFLDIKRPSADIATIAERTVTAVQALCACVVGYKIVTNCYQDVLHDTHWLTDAYAHFGATYFFYDIFAMFRTYYLKTPATLKQPLKQKVVNFMWTQPFMLMHHLVFPFIYLPVIVWWRGNLGDFFVGCFYLTELPVPFVAFRGVLKQFNQKETALYKVNGVVLIIMWIVCRILVFPFMFWAYAIQQGLSWWQVPHHIPVKCCMGCALLLAFQLYWLSIMLIIAARTFCRDSVIGKWVLKN